ncbi:MAG TPA: zinc-ribbon domain-containing protein [Terriglobales bacterium]|nr:zinc-ribbon domain-containing protein [Terriglobales bacterium]
MICPKCGEVNSESFRFCGMCGTPLEARRPASTPTLDPLSAFPSKVSPRVTTAADSIKPAVAEAVARHVNKPVPPISGPSMLGLNQPVADESMPSPTSASQSVSSQSRAVYTTPAPPSIDLLRETSFSSFDAFMEPEKPKTSVGRILLLLVLLAGLGIAGWWAYTNYLGATESRKLQTAISNADEAPAGNTAQKSAAPPTDETKDRPSTKSAAPGETASDNSSSQTSPSPATAPAAATDSQPGSAAPNPTAADTEANSAAPAKQTPATAPISPTPTSIPKTSPAHKLAPKHEPLMAAARPPSRPEPAAADTGDAAFRRGEAYLYGRGIRENCDEAVKNLKIASAQSNAKARSTFGTMYATGHCVPRDLPTSYLWFALALRADPTNQILEKDLNAVWNQMTPPERQQATRMKQ